MKFSSGRLYVLGAIVAIGIFGSSIAEAQPLFTPQALVNTETRASTIGVTFRPEQNFGGAGSVAVWTFGDGSQSQTTTGITPVTHVYTAGPGVYPASVTVTSEFGGSATSAPVNITILPDNVPFVEFVGIPRFGGLGLTTSFTAPSVFSNLVGFNPATDIASVTWSFGDGSLPQTGAFGQPITHTFNAAGSFDIGLIVTFNNGADPLIQTHNDYVVVFQTIVSDLAVSVGGGIAIQDANGDLTDGALLPNQDWMPLYHFTMTPDEDTDTGAIAERCLSRIRFQIDSGGSAFEQIEQIRMLDFIEWGVFEDNETDAEEGPLLNWVDNLLFTWTTDGSPFGTATELTNTDGSDIEVFYDIDLFGNNLQRLVSTLGGEQRFMVAFRTSSVFRNGTGVTLNSISGVTMFASDIVDCDTGQVVFDENGDIAASVPEDPIGFDNDVQYTSNFTVWDHTGDEDPRFPFTEVVLIGGANLWEHPRFMFTPLAEHSRSRFDLAGNFFDAVTGEIIYIREVVAVEEYFPLIDINVHAAPAPWTYDITATEVPNGYRSNGSVSEAPRIELFSGLREVNIIMTDIGGDPFGPPGNGGFDPRTMLDTMTNASTGITDTAFGFDYGLNGIGVAHDSNNNANFDPPEMSGSGGVTFTDLPMTPSGANNVLDGYEPGWEYIPFPPGGGDPWWKIKLAFSGNSRDGTAGKIEPIPDAQENIPANLHPDYFVYMRADSGFQDVSGLPGDGTGIRPGADFRCFIEPRRFSTALGSWDGGIYVDSMQMFGGSPITSVQVLDPWQDDARWDFPNLNEPYFPQRTLNKTTAKPVRVGVEVYDLGITYSSNNGFALPPTGVEYGGSGLGVGTGFADPGRTFWDQWLDPFFVTQDQFFDRHSVGNIAGFILAPFAVGPFIAFEDDGFFLQNFSYETVPFFNPTFDTPPLGPRSSFWAPPNMLNQPGLPTYDTWLPFQASPSDLPPGEYPREADWEPQNRSARRLFQHIDALSDPTPVLGINVAGVADPVTNRLAPVMIEQITIAFYGDDFTPGDLLELDPGGVGVGSGVVLMEDSGADGVNFGGVFGDTAVPLLGLAWQENPEPVDLDGDRIADDLNGDGVVDLEDRAWVLTLRPRERWRVPTDDYRLAGGLGTIIGDDPLADEDDTTDGGGDTGILGGDDDDDAIIVRGVYRQPENWTKSVMRIDRTKLDRKIAEKRKEAQNKELPTGGKAGIDLWLVIQTSPTIDRFEHFRALVPATLPSRASNQQRAGVEFFPRVDVAPDTYFSRDPDENPVQDWYNHEGLVANVPTHLTKLTGSGQTISVNSGDVAVLAVDASTNRQFEAIADSSFNRGVGVGGASGDRTFQVPNAPWVRDQFVGYFLIDSNYEPFEIVPAESATLPNDTLQLLSGTPASGPWQIIIDPTFLEYLIVELYDNETDGDFDLFEDLLPLNIDQRISGVALYRDNDFNPANRNGIFDPLIDIPLRLDFEPYLTGVAGEPQNQIKFVFASPGVDDVPQPGFPRGLANQPRNRQVIPDFSGLEFNPALQPLLFAQTEQYLGPEFFVVVRVSENLEVGDDFRAAIVSWGPATPSSPDPNTFPPPPAAPQDEFDKFQEYPWGTQALGYVTMYRDPPDLTGFRFYRSTAAKEVVTDVITAVAPAVDEDQVVITSVTPQILPVTVGEIDRDLTIFGFNFGTQPQVTLNGVPLEVVAATDTRIDALIPVGFMPVAPVVLVVTNLSTGSFDSRDDLFLIGDVPSPRLISVDPSRGNASVFPVTIIGRNFGPSSRVFFDSTEMVVLPGGTDTTLRVSMPNGGLPRTGFYEVAVVTTLEVDGAFIDVRTSLPDGFFFENPIIGGGGQTLPVSLPVPCFIATAAYGTSHAEELESIRIFRDEWLFQSAVGRTLVDGYYTISPPVADTVARSPFLAAIVRVMLSLFTIGIYILPIPVLAAIALRWPLAAPPKDRGKGIAH